MKFKTPIATVLLLAGLFSSGLALADRGHGHVGIGFYFGPGPYYQPYYHPYGYYPYPYPYYPYPPPVIVAPAPQEPPVYIEQNNPPPAPEASAAPRQDYYWYHCDKPEGYYPYVKECPGGWQRVTPEPPKQP